MSPLFEDHLNDMQHNDMRYTMEPTNSLHSLTEQERAHTRKAAQVLSSMLEAGNFGALVPAAQQWLLYAPQTAVPYLIESCPPEQQAKLILLLSDLLARYPQNLAACPVLLYPMQLDKTVQYNELGMGLPVTRSSLRSPAKDVNFLGWLPAQPLLARPDEYLAAQGQLRAPWYQCSAALAVFEVPESFFGLEEAHIAPQWWSDLFFPTAGAIKLTARLMLPYPQAQEAARIMLDCATEKNPDMKSWFLPDPAKSWALQEGLLFLHNCQSQLGAQWKGD